MQLSGFYGGPYMLWNGCYWLPSFYKPTLFLDAHWAHLYVSFTIAYLYSSLCVQRIFHLWAHHAHRPWLVTPFSVLSSFLLLSCLLCSFVKDYQECRGDRRCLCCLSALEIRLWQPQNKRFSPSGCSWYLRGTKNFEAREGVFSKRKKILSWLTALSPLGPTSKMWLAQI